MPEGHNGGLDMRILAMMFLALQLVGGTLALACDEMCPDSEMYSESAEMCVPKEQPST